jgi:hypothetical protein
MVAEVREIDLAAKTVQTLGRAGGSLPEHPT